MGSAQANDTSRMAMRSRRANFTSTVEQFRGDKRRTKPTQHPPCGHSLTSPVPRQNPRTQTGGGRHGSSKAGICSFYPRSAKVLIEPRRFSVWVNRYSRAKLRAICACNDDISLCARQYGQSLLSFWPEAGTKYYILGSAPFGPLKQTGRGFA